MLVTTILLEITWCNHQHCCVAKSFLRILSMRIIVCLFGLYSALCSFLRINVCLVWPFSFCHCVVFCVNEKKVYTIPPISTTNSHYKALHNRLFQKRVVCTKFIKSIWNSSFFFTNTTYIF